MTNADKFKNIFGLYATELWSMPEKDFLKWLNSEAMNCSEFPNNSDSISRQAAIDAIRKIYDSVGILGEKWAVDKCQMAIKDLPSAEPEIKPIDYQDCANAMLRMWMDEVITDGEYNRVMDKLNAFWRTRNEQSD